MKFDLDDLLKLYIANVLINRGLYAGDALHIAQGSHLQLLAYVAERSTEFAPDVPKSKRKTWASKMPEFAQKRYRRFFVIGSEDVTDKKRLVHCDDVSKAFDMWRKLGITSEAAIVLDIETLAEQIVEKAGRPLMRVEVVDDE